MHKTAVLLRLIGIGLCDPIYLILTRLYGYLVSPFSGAYDKGLNLDNMLTHGLPLLHLDIIFCIQLIMSIYISMYCRAVPTSPFHLCYSTFIRVNISKQVCYLISYAYFMLQKWQRSN